MGRRSPAVVDDKEIKDATTFMGQLMQFYPGCIKVESSGCECHVHAFITFPACLHGKPEHLSYPGQDGRARAKVTQCTCLQFDPSCQQAVTVYAAELPLEPREVLKAIQHLKEVLRTVSFAALYI